MKKITLLGFIFFTFFANSQATGVLARSNFATTQFTEFGILSNSIEVLVKLENISSNNQYGIFDSTTSANPSNAIRILENLTLGEFVKIIIPTSQEDRVIFIREIFPSGPSGSSGSRVLSDLQIFSINNQNSSLNLVNTELDSNNSIISTDTSLDLRTFDDNSTYSIIVRNNNGLVVLDADRDIDSTGLYTIENIPINNGNSTIEILERSNFSRRSNAVARIPIVSPDSDGDGILNADDNCPNNPNPDQADSDNDGIGDVCDNQDNNDGDGVDNFEDDCPDDPGSASNNGCPEEETNIDLMARSENVIIFSDCTSCAPPLSDLGNNRHLFNSSASSLTINPIRIENVGNTSSQATDVVFYRSNNSTLERNNDFRIDRDISLGAINAGGFSDETRTISFSNLGLSNAFQGNIFILISIDDSDNNDETNEDNNVIAIPIRVDLASGNDAPTCILCPIDIIPFFGIENSDDSILLDNNQFEKPYQMEVYNLQGIKVLTKQVNGTKDEDTSVQTLTGGIYIIRTEKGFRKVLVNNR